MYETNRQTIITQLAAAADELHRSGAGHPNVVKAIEQAIAHMNADVIDPVEAEKARVRSTDQQDALNKDRLAKEPYNSERTGETYKPRVDAFGKPVDPTAVDPATGKPYPHDAQGKPYTDPVTGKANQSGMLNPNTSIV